MGNLTQTASKAKAVTHLGKDLEFKIPSSAFSSWKEIRSLIKYTSSGSVSSLTHGSNRNFQYLSQLFIHRKSLTCSFTNNPRNVMFINE